LPNLAHHPDDTFRKHSVTELLRWDTKLEGNGKLGRKLTEKMLRNLDNMKKNPKKVEAGDDQFGEREFGVANERISFVTNFIDEVLVHNAKAWDDVKPFMTAHEISTKWVAAVMLRGPKPSTSHQSKNRNKQNNSRKLNALDRSVEVPKDVCRRYNAKNCPSQNDKTCKAPWDNTTDLKHTCPFRLPDKSFCLKDHPLAEHK
jgi:hypothetical protein